ncbi:MAG: histidine phosphatase family protein [Blastocatellales bacterium]
MTRFLLIRHGMTDSVGRAVAGWTPGVYLNDKGRWEAARLAERLADAPIKAIYSSPLERACETAQPISRKFGLDVQVVEDVGEVKFGEWTGRELSELNNDPLWRRFNSLRSLTRAPGGETQLEAQARMIAALELLRARHPDQMVAVVSHGDVIKSAIAYYAGIPLDLFHRVEIGTASVSVVEVGGHYPHIVCVNNTGELF